MTAKRLDPDRDLHGDPDCLGAPARRLHDRRVRGAGRFPAPGRARDLRALRRRRAARSSTGSFTASACCCSTSPASCCSTGCSGCNIICRSTRRSRPAISPDSSFNTAVSFITNTNWQSYTPESTMSYLAQMAGLTVQNFVSAAAGIVLSVVLIRGFARRSAQTIGNFWVDMTRCVLYILLADLDRRRAWCWCGRGCRRTSAPIPRRQRSKAPSR